LWTTSRAIDRVAVSKAAREGHLREWRELLERQRWHIATALAALTRARAMLRDNAAALPDLAAAEHAVSAAIERRAEEVLRYADGVDDLDRSLGELDSVVQRDAVDHHLREARAAVADELTPAALAQDVRQAREGVQAALDALRQLPAA
jgi:hypothetical protein